MEYVTALHRQRKEKSIARRSLFWHSLLKRSKARGFIRFLGTRKSLYPFLSAVFCLLTVLIPYPARAAALFDGYVTFAKSIFTSAFSAIGLSGLNSFTEQIGVLIQGVILLLSGGWIMYQCYEAIQSYRQKEFQGMWDSVTAIVFAVLILFVGDFVLKQMLGTTAPTT